MQRFGIDSTTIGLLETVRQFLGCFFFNKKKILITNAVRQLKAVLCLILQSCFSRCLPLFQQNNILDIYVDKYANFKVIFCFADLEARPWDFQAEECALRACVDLFNNRRYSSAPRDEELEPVDTSVTSVLGANIELTDEFKQHYELWLQQEVFQTSIDWDELLGPSCEI